MLRILLAEDNRGDVLLVRASLEHHGVEHELRVVEDAQQALDYVGRMGIAEAPYPDLVLLDLNLPKGEGATVLGALRQHPVCSGMPVIVVTSSDSPRDRERMRQLGVSYYFRKPSEYDEYLQLGGIVRQVVERAAG